jgi:salicylate 5-hydroxylase large subunit
MNAPDTLSRWRTEGSSRVPFWAYTDAQLYQRELERIFYGAHWCYVGLEAEIPNTGDYKLSHVGERQVIMVRDRVAPKDRGTDPGIRVVENRCAHRGVRFCQEPHGTARSFVCPYHQWTYKLNGDLAGLPFKDGVKDGECTNGGMPADFNLQAHGLTKLRVATLHGLVFATFSDQTEPLEEYLGPQILPWLNRIFQRPDGPAKLTLLGYNRQRIPGNWKLMQENIKDPYHPGLLHTWFVTFGLWRADQKSRMVMDAQGRHAVMVSRRNDGGENAR